MQRLSGPPRNMPSKFRVRLGNEQISLPLGMSVIGRESGCFIAILDASISRRHVRILCDGERATIEDLGSRNGTRLNGVLLSGPHAAHAGDRIGLGSYELVIDVADATEQAFAETPTGRLNVCSACRTCFASEVDVCPGCGLKVGQMPLEAGRSEESTRGRWSLGLLVETLGKTLLTKSPRETERLMQEAANIVNTRLREQAPLDPDELRALADAAAWLDKAQKSSVWLDWMGSVYEQLAAHADAR